MKHSPVWGSVLPMLLLGQAQPDADLNPRTIPNFFENDMVGIWKNTRKGSLIVGFGNADESGKAEIRKISPGRHVIVVTMLTDRCFYLWVQEKDYPKATPQQFKAVAGSSGHAPVPHIPDRSRCQTLTSHRIGPYNHQWTFSGDGPSRDGLIPEP